MQMTEDLIRSVVQQVLSQMGTGSPSGNGAKPSGNFGVHPTADSAVTASEAAFEEFRKRPLSHRKAAIDCVRNICREQACEHFS